MNKKYLSDEEIRQEGIQALIDRLGPDGMIRFLQHFEKGKGNYTKEREKLFIGETVDSIFDKVIEKKTKPRKC
jgi:hypothetical protein